MSNSSDLNIAMTLSLKDKLVAPLQEAVTKIEREFQDMAQQAKRTTEALASTVEKLTAIGQQSSQVSKATAEIKKQGEEARKTEQQISRLGQAWKTAQHWSSNISAGVAGATAFKMIAADPLQRAADYDMQLRGLANTAYAGKPLADRRAGMQTMSGAIMNAVRSGGGTREGALDTLNELIASGAFGDDPSEAIKMLPGIIKAATASGAEPNNLAKIAVRAKQSMGLGSGDLGLLLDRAMIAGQEGGFELKDMSKWLPQQMALARSLGMRGQSGVMDLLAANQASVITAGTRDEAGNNLVSLLEHLNSHSTQHVFQRQFGINLTGTLAKATEQGMSPLDAIVKLVDQVAGSDANYQSAKRKAASVRGAKLSDAEKQDAYLAESDLLKGSVVGKLFPERQALMALIGLMNGREYTANIRSKMVSGKGAIDDNAALMTEGAGYTYAQREAEVQNAQTEAMNDANSAVSKLAQAQIDLYRRYPGFAESLEAAKLAVEGVTAAIGAWGALKFLTGGAGASGAAAVAAEAVAADGAVATSGGAAALLTGPVRPIIAGGALLSAVAANVVANNQEAFSGTADGGMLGAMSGDTGFAAAIMEAAEATKEAATQAKEAAVAAKAAADRPIELHLDSTKMYDSIEDVANRLSRRK